VNEKVSLYDRHSLRPSLTLCDRHSSRPSLFATVTLCDRHSLQPSLATVTLFDRRSLRPSLFASLFATVTLCGCHSLRPPLCAISFLPSGLFIYSLLRLCMSDFSIVASHVVRQTAASDINTTMRLENVDQEDIIPRIMSSPSSQRKTARWPDLTQTNVTGNWAV
jgi:hypothetical protein